MWADATDPAQEHRAAGGTYRPAASVGKALVAVPFCFAVRLVERGGAGARPRLGVTDLGVDSGCYWIVDDTGFPKKGKRRSVSLGSTVTNRVNKIGAK